MISGLRRLSIVAVAVFGTTLCQASVTLHVGTLAGSETELLKFIKLNAIQKYGIRIKIIKFKEENLLNMALDEGTVDVNLFQYQTYLDQSLKQHHYRLLPIGETFMYPMGIYSENLTHLKEIRKGCIVAIPCNVAHQDRALRLLESAQLIKLKVNTKALANTDAIQDNPYELVFKTVEAGELSSILSCADLTIMQAHEAWLAQLSPNTEALFQEKPNKAYVHLIVAHEKFQNEEKLKKLVDLFGEEKVFLFLEKMFQNRVYRIF